MLIYTSLLQLVMFQDCHARGFAWDLHHAGCLSDSLLREMIRISRAHPDAALTIPDIMHLWGYHFIEDQSFREALTQRRMDARADSACSRP